jgi:transcriptional regulator with XRE-family HTH domain
MIIAPIAKSSIVLVLCKRSCCSGVKMNSKFSQWLNERFLEWEKQQGKRQTVSAFARYLDVPQSSLSSWMAGAYVPSGENLLLLATKLGAEIYDTLGISRPPIADPDVIYIASVWNRLSDTDRETIISTIKDKVK